MKINSLNKANKARYIFGTYRLNTGWILIDKLVSLLSVITNTYLQAKYRTDPYHKHILIAGSPMSNMSYKKGLNCKLPKLFKQKT